jgi:hypothetical protein
MRCLGSGFFLVADRHGDPFDIPMFLTRHGLLDKTTPRSIRVDQGGEFAFSEDFHKVVAKHGYVVEPTGSDNPSQNGRVESLNQTFGIMVRTLVRSLLYSSGLPPRFWSDALLHAVYLKNRLWHSAIGRTPYEAFFSEKPDLSHFVFSAPSLPLVSPANALPSSITTRFMASFSTTPPPISTCGTMTRPRVASRQLATLSSTKPITCHRGDHLDFNSYTILVWKNSLIRILDLQLRQLLQLSPHCRPWLYLHQYWYPS